jgi:DNA polymerase-3 subunit alpha
VWLIDENFSELCYMIIAKSYYSLRYGVAPVEALVRQAAAHGMKTLCLADINNTSGVIELVKHCREHGIRPVAGIDFRNGDTWLYTGIALNNQGFYQLNDFLSRYRLARQSLPDQPLALEGAVFILPYRQKDPHDLGSGEYMGIRPHEVNRIVGNEYPTHAGKMVMLQPVTFLESDDLELHRHLRAIDHNALLSQLEDHWLAGDDEFFYDPRAVREKYASFPELVEQSDKILQQAQFSFEKGLKNKKTFTGERQKDRERLETLAYEGMEKRYGVNDPVARERVARELEIIHQLGFAAYFLITHDIVRFSMSQGFYHVGRGSGANSVVAYCLYITDVDPIELNLYFERFINPKRTSPPDFDIDYSWKERDRVLDYIFETYPNEHTALLGTISTFRGKSIVRELAKVYGLPQPGYHNQPDFSTGREADRFSQPAEYTCRRGDHLRETGYLVHRPGPASQRLSHHPVGYVFGRRFGV